MADGKWITGLKPATPLHVAALRVLEVRLGLVSRLLPKAAHLAHKDVEHVHRLRVATRRARAAIDLFANCLSEKLYKRLRQTLRRIRRSAGDARDCDVFLPRLRERISKASEGELPGLYWLAGQLAFARAFAQQGLTAQGGEAEEAMKRHLTSVGEELREAAANGAPCAGLRTHAGPHLLQLVTELEEQANGDLNDPGRLHQVRICGKRLRYAIEVFADGFAAALKADLYPVVEEMQDILGHINDHAVAVERLRAIRTQARRFEREQWPLWRPGVDSLQRAERKRFAAGRKQFRRFWEDWLKKNFGQQFREIVQG